MPRPSASGGVQSAATRQEREQQEKGLSKRTIGDEREDLRRRVEIRAWSGDGQTATERCGAALTLSLSLCLLCSSLPTLLSSIQHDRQSVTARVRSARSRLPAALSDRSLSLLSPLSAADASILTQRFLESEGELGRSFKGVLTKFGELQQALANPPRKVAAASTDAMQDTSVAVATAAPSAEDLYQSLQRELASFDVALAHTRLIQESGVDEMRTYESAEAHTLKQINATVASLVQLQAELESAKQWRRDQEEYESLHKQLASLPTRMQTQQEIEKQILVHRALEQEKIAILMEAEAKRKNHGLLSLAFEQLRAQWLAAETSESTRSSRALAEAEAEAERRRAEEEALAFAAAAEAKADSAAAADADAEEGEDDEKSKANSAAGAPPAEGEEEEEGSISMADVAAASAASSSAAASSNAAASTGTAAADASADSTATDAKMPTPTRNVSEDSLAVAASTPAESPSGSPNAARADTPTPMET